MLHAYLCLFTLFNFITVQNIEIKKQQKLLEQEHKKIMKVADKLDSHVTQLMLKLEKKSVELNQTLETLQKREQSLSHEKKMFEEKVQWERNHLQVGNHLIWKINTCVNIIIFKKFLYFYIYYIYMQL